MGVSASGCHHNLSLWRDGQETLKPFDMESLPELNSNFTYRMSGENTFLPEPDASDRRISRTVELPCIGGVMEHLGALTAIGCSTVN